jgi:hypothetical protein
MNPDPSLASRILDWCWAVVWNWKGLLAGLSLAYGFILPLFLPRLLQLSPDRRPHWLDKILRPELHRRGLIVLCFLLISAFQVYDEVSTKLRHVSSELPDFNKVTTWSVSFEAFITSESISSDLKATAFVLLHRCRFTNLSSIQARILDIKLTVPTNVPEIPVVTLDTESMPFQEYRKSFTDKGFAVDESAGGRMSALIKTPIYLEPNQSTEGIVEFDVYDENVKRQMLVHAEHTRTWLQYEFATITVTDRRSEMSKTIKINQAYHATTGAITKIEHDLSE